MNYTNPSEPADNINILLEYLDTIDGANSDNRFAFRGQSNEYFFQIGDEYKTPFPLLPSKYRFHWDVTFDPQKIKHDFAGHGDTFVKVNFPPKITEMVMFWIKTNGFNQPYPIQCDLQPIEESIHVILEALGVNYRNPPLHISNNNIDYWNPSEPERERFSRVLRGIFTELHGSSFDSRDLIEELRSFVHRLTVEAMAGEMFFGSPTSSFLCQQYGITSGYLDASLSKDIAAFFATHEAPFYDKCKTDNCGIIYRFDISRHYSLAPSRSQTPAVLVGKELFLKFEKDGVEFADIHPNLEHFHGMVFEDRNNREKIDEILAVPTHSFANSRIGRQESVMLSAMQLANIRSDGCHVTEGIEDISSRSGCAKFYFRHTATPPRKGDINREWLWPNAEDVFLEWIRYQMSQARNVISTSRNDGYYVLPKRLDLIDDGYRK
jgi:hypothetical protein